ncbi:TPA: hypothetical protein ACNCH9_005303, partial [Escherichia coli]
HAASGINYSWQTAAAKAFLHMALEECADVGGNESR